MQVEEKMRDGRAQRSRACQVGARQAGDPVVRQEDLPFAAALAEESHCPTDEVDVSAAQTDHLMDPDARRHHQSDG